MSNKLKLYLKFGEKDNEKSFLSTLDKYNQYSQKLSINQGSEMSFIGILKFLLKNFKNINDITELEIEKKLIDKSDSKKIFKVHILDFLNNEIALVRQLSNEHRVWYGFKMIKSKNSLSVYDYYEGYMSNKSALGVPKTIEKFGAKRDLKKKVLQIENDINRSFL